MTKKDKNIGNSMNKAVELTQKSAIATLKGAVGTADMTESYIQGVYKAGYDANVDALKVAKGYWDATSEIRQDWVKLMAETGETVIDRAAAMDVPFQKEAMKMGGNIVGTITKTFEGFVPRTKNAK